MKRILNFCFLLLNAGYATCITGKWQLGNGCEGPKQFSFDKYILRHLFDAGNRYKNPMLSYNWQTEVATNFGLDSFRHNLRRMAEFLVSGTIPHVHIVPRSQPFLKCALA